MTTSKFKIWDEFNSTSGLGKTIIRAPFIGVSPKGKMTFSTSLVEGLKLTQDSRIIFLEGEDGSWFLCKTKDHGLLFTKKKDKENFLTMSAAKLSAYLAQKYGFERRVHVRVSTVPETFPKKEGLPTAGYRLYFNEIKK